MTRLQLTIVFLILILAGAILRLIFVWQQPFSNDEGAYLYDAATLRDGRLPGGDILTKSPLVISLFMVSEFLSHGSIFAARYGNALISLLTAIPLYALSRAWGGKKLGLIVVALWLISSSNIIFQSLGQTETLASFCSVLFLCLWYKLSRSSNSLLANNGLAVGAGLSFVASIASRKSGIAIILPAFFMVLFSAHQYTDKLKYSLITAISAVMGFCVWVAAILFMYGQSALPELIGVGYLETAWANMNSSTVFPSWGSTFNLVFDVAWRAAPIHVLLLIAAAIWSSNIFYRYFNNASPHLPSGFVSTTEQVLALWLWLIGLAALYTTWPTFLPDYLADFLPAITLLGSLMLWRLSKQRQLFIILSSLLLIVNTASLYSVYQKPWTGMFAPDAVVTAARFIRTEIPFDQPIFTAATIIAYESGHKVLFDVAHPLWYRYEFIPEETKSIFLPPLATVERSVVDGEVKWAITEQLTDYAYLRHQSNLLSVITRDWQLVAEIPNQTGYRNNPLRIWRRK